VTTNVKKNPKSTSDRTIIIHLIKILKQTTEYVGTEHAGAHIGTVLYRRRRKAYGVLLNMSEHNLGMDMALRIF